MTNQNNPLCKTTTKYSETPDYIFRGMSMGADKTTQNHISSMNGCKAGEYTVQEMKKSQSWIINGNYDYAAHEGNIEKGKQMDVSPSKAFAMLNNSLPGLDYGNRCRHGPSATGTCSETCEQDSGKSYRHPDGKENVCERKTGVIEI